MYTLDMREVEAKARLRNPDSVIAELTKRGILFGEPKSQRDYIYVEKTGGVEAYLDNTLFLRIRETDTPGALFTAKYNADRRAQMKTGDFAATEHETRVADAGELRAILALLGYTEAVQVEKTRRTGKYEPYEICIDELSGEGAFIEVEMLTDTDPESAHEEMWKFLETVGVPRSDQCFDRYDILMLKQKS